MRPDPAIGLGDLEDFGRVVLATRFVDLVRLGLREGAPSMHARTQSSGHPTWSGRRRILGVRWHGAGWVADRRALHGSALATAGRTGTRAPSGQVALRWQGPIQEGLVIVATGRTRPHNHRSHPIDSEPVRDLSTCARARTSPTGGGEQAGGECQALRAGA